MPQPLHWTNLNYVKIWQDLVQPPLAPVVPILYHSRISDRNTPKFLSIAPTLGYTTYHSIFLSLQKILLYMFVSCMILIMSYAVLCMSGSVLEVARNHFPLGGFWIQSIPTINRKLDWPSKSVKKRATENHEFTYALWTDK